MNERKRRIMNDPEAYLRDIGMYIDYPALWKEEPEQLTNPFRLARAHWVLGPSTETMNALKRQLSTPEARANALETIRGLGRRLDEITNVYRKGEIREISSWAFDEDIAYNGPNSGRGSNSLWAAKVRHRDILAFNAWDNEAVIATDKLMNLRRIG